MLAHFGLLAQYVGSGVGSCVVYAIIIGLIVTGLAWLIPPTRAYCLMIGGAVALLALLGCFL